MWSRTALTAAASAVDRSRSARLVASTRPSIALPLTFVEDNRDEFGVEFICRHLQVAPSSYHAAKKRQVAPSARAVRDATLTQVLLTSWVANRRVYGAHKLWKPPAGRGMTSAGTRSPD